ncbi:UNVERIFIED_CONTAM: hypothetical protein Sradi_5732900 [Sesamum radiatum]|uniref:Uncharacterized protein n=1 Tax=Sesamum radiatum TaxID=300843 RepID=A0AAW2L243_SESRA
MYTKAGGKGTNICIYYSPPGQTLNNGIKLLEGDAVRELLRDYKGVNVIHLYVVETSGPIVAVDALGNAIEDNVKLPQLTYEGVDERVGEDTRVNVEAGAKTVNEGVSEEIGVGAEVEDEAGARGETVNEGPGIGVGEDEGDENSEENEEYEDGGAFEDNDTSSSSSECPSWMLQDLKGPMDDDLSVSRGAEYGRKLIKKHKGLGGEADLHSLRGSDDEIGDNLVWNDSMERQDLDLCIGMKFAIRIKYREVLRDWAAKRG